MLTSFIL